MKPFTVSMGSSSAVEKNCQTGSSNGSPAAMPMRMVPAAVVFGTPTATIAGMPMMPAIIAAGAEPVTVPMSAETARTPRATTVGRSPPNSTILRTRVPAMPVSSISLPSQEPMSTASMVAASAGAPCWITVSRTLLSPVSGAPAAIAMAMARSTRAKAVGSLRVSMSPTPASMSSRMTIPMAGLSPLRGPGPRSRARR